MKPITAIILLSSFTEKMTVFLKKKLSSIYSISYYLSGPKMPKKVHGHSAVQISGDLYTSMTQLQSHTFASFTGPSLRLKTMEE